MISTNTVIGVLSWISNYISHKNIPINTCQLISVKKALDHWTCWCWIVYSSIEIFYTLNDKDSAVLCPTVDLHLNKISDIHTLILSFRCHQWSYQIFVGNIVPIVYLRRSLFYWLSPFMVTSLYRHSYRAPENPWVIGDFALQEASDGELWCSLFYWRAQAVKQILEWPVVQTPWRYCNAGIFYLYSFASSNWKYEPLTHWGRVKLICGGNLVIIGSDNGLSPRRSHYLEYC